MKKHYGHEGGKSKTGNKKGYHDKGAKKLNRQTGYNDKKGY